MVFDITKIGEIRKRHGFTQKQFANRIGLSQSMIAKIEAGRIDPSYSSVKKIEAFVSSFTREKEIEAKEIMVKKIISVDKCMNARKVIEMMNRHTISQMPVLEGDNVVGIVTESSILNKDLRDMERLSARDLMIEPPPILPGTAKISVVAYILKSYPIVLIKKEGKLAGLITKSDLLKRMIHE